MLRLRILESYMNGGKKKVNSLISYMRKLRPIAFISIQTCFQNIICALGLLTLVLSLVFMLFY